jgi:uncharacterized protein (TIGR03118 family)
MKTHFGPFKAAVLIGISMFSYCQAASFVETDLVVNRSPLMDANGIVHTGQVVDPNLVNAWGISESTGSPFWVSDNGAGVATLYNTSGMPVPLVVSIPAPGDPLGKGGTPTGTVFNNTGGFMISGVTIGGLPTTMPAVFLFATEDGTIVGWNPNVNPQNFSPSKAGTYGIIAAHPDNAVYKGLAIATDSHGVARLYATNFHKGTVDVFDTSFNIVSSSGAFTDNSLPRGYAPFDIVLLSGKLFVTYAVQDDAGHDDVAGMGHGIVNTFDLSGDSLHRFAQHGQLDSPWGVALAPANFGELAGTIWIGNFGNGQINAYNASTGEFVDKVRNPHGQAIVIDGLWALRVGNGVMGGLTNKVYFTAGPNDESDGLFGSLTPQ